MVREVKEHAVRRRELLDAAQRLVFTKGYEQTAIQDLLDELGIAKGTFYHYFKSKRDLLQAMVDRLTDDALDLVNPIVDDPGLSAIEKLQQLFDAIGGWKTANRDYHLALLGVWYADDNAVARWRVRVTRVARMRPLIATIVQQGIEEGTMHAQAPAATAEVVLSMLQELVDALALHFLPDASAGSDPSDVDAVMAAYTDAVERVIGVTPGSLSLVTPDVLAQWVDASATGHRARHQSNAAEV